MEKKIICIPATKNMMKKEPTEILNVAVYCRVSSQSDEQYGSLEVQINYYTALINDNSKWNCAGIYAETETGRTIKNRAEFKKLLSKYRKHKADMIITKSISRFFKNTVDALEVCRELRMLSVEVVFEKENLLLSNPKTMFDLEIACVLAQEEIHNHSQNIIMGIHYVFEKGNKCL